MAGLVAGECYAALRFVLPGAGGGALEIRTAARLAPAWSFVAVDPSEPMMEIARFRLEEAGLTGRTTFHAGYVGDLPRDVPFDAATLIGVLHHVPGDAAKHELLTSIAERMRSGAPLTLAGNRYAYESRSLLLATWAERWRLQGAGDEEVRVKLARIRQGAEPPESDEAVVGLLVDAGFSAPSMFFSSLFWGAWVATKR